MAEDNTDKKGLFLKIVLVIVVAILPVAGFVLGMEYEKRQSPNDQAVILPDQLDETSIGNEVDDETGDTITYTGDIVSAELPAGWNIVEYFDGDGSETLVQGVDYSGLTGLEILKEDEVVFAVRGVSGIGGISACSDLVVFTDTAVGYVDNITDEAALAGITTTTLSILDDDLVEIDFLGTRLRRVSRTYYWDMDTTSDSFDTNCGLDGSAFPFTGVSFYSDLGKVTENEIATYWYELSDTAPMSDLEVLDAILASFVVL